MHNRSKPQRGTPESIIARLYSLAGLAERAACHVWVVRIVVLWILRRAECAVGGFVVDCASNAGLDEVIEQIDELFAMDMDEGSVSEALRLAGAFRALAMILSYLAANGFFSSFRHRYPGSQPRLIAARTLRNVLRQSRYRSIGAYQEFGRPEVRRGALPRPS